MIENMKTLFDATQNSTVKMSLTSNKRLIEILAMLDYTCQSYVEE
jgi:methylmalonyl-CoA mutase N-terminal domain/subunit